MIKTKKKNKPLPNGFMKNPDLDKYANQELFKEKMAKANHILKTVGIPKV